MSPEPANLPRPRRATGNSCPPRQLERYLQNQVRHYLEHRSWRVFRHTVAVATSGPTTFSVGEPGMPDLQAIHYFPAAVSLTLWIETKQPGKGLRDRQRQWHQREQERGAMVWVLDSFEQFLADYQRVFGWLHQGEYGRGQRELLFGDFPGELQPF